MASSSAVGPLVGMLLKESDMNPFEGGRFREPL